MGSDCIILNVVLGFGLLQTSQKNNYRSKDERNTHLVYSFLFLLFVKDGVINFSIYYSEGRFIGKEYKGDEVKS